MIVRSLLVMLTMTFVATAPVRAQEALVTYKSLNPEVALELARAALADCRRRDYQVAVAVVDRFGVTRTREIVRMIQEAGTG